MYHESRDGPPIGAAYNAPRVARTLVLTLALLIGALACADRFVCPDGCTDEAPASFDCVLCHGFFFDDLTSSAAPSLTIARATPSELSLPPTPAPHSIEHPPRANV